MMRTIYAILGYPFGVDHVSVLPPGKQLRPGADPVLPSLTKLVLVPFAVKQQKSISKWPLSGQNGRDPEKICK